jgi:hypothetical protein
VLLKEFELGLLRPLPLRYVLEIVDVPPNEVCINSDMIARLAAAPSVADAASFTFDALGSGCNASQANHTPIAETYELGFACVFVDTIVVGHDVHRAVCTDGDAFNFLL